MSACAGDFLRMPVRRNNIHSAKVDEWEKTASKNIPPADHPQLYAKALHAIVRRSLNTLSSITVMVVMERVIRSTTVRYPILSKVRLNEEIIDFSNVLTDAPSATVKEALRAMLVELLTIFGNITADILTASLHDELMKINMQTPLKLSAQQTLPSINPKKKTRDKK